MEHFCCICSTKFETPELLNAHQITNHSAEDLSVALITVQGYRLYPEEMITTEITEGENIDMDNGDSDEEVDTSSISEEDSVEVEVDEIAERERRKHCNICTLTFAELCERGIIACNKCLTRFDSENGLAQHDCFLQKFKFFNCPGCDMKFLSKKSCIDHCLSVHKPKSWNKCIYCNMVFFEDMEFHLHLDDHVYGP